MIKRIYTNPTKGMNENYLAGWNAWERGEQRLPYDRPADPKSQAGLDFQKGYYDRGRFWMTQHEAT